MFSLCYTHGELNSEVLKFLNPRHLADHLCGLVVRVLGYKSGGLGSIPGTTRRKKK
jgi:hypothetical protein